MQALPDFVPGQRWINDAELQLGLGTVLTVEHRTVQIVFLASGETRVYAKQTAPLTRVRFNAGDEIRCDDGSLLEIESLVESDGLLIYQGTTDSGERRNVPETMLDNFIQLNKPQERLFTGQIDHNKWFELRYQSWFEKARLAHSELHGLTGARTSLIPHQLYIAHEVARRFAPRVLLADEVGLGKTIEAGLILHHQLLTERAHRALIVVPDPLLHQWLVEMLRKFNLHFSIFDQQRLAAEAGEVLDEFGEEPAIEETLNEELADTNPFMQEQLVLCSLDFLRDNPSAFEQAAAAEWDLLIVDEAHHLEWSETAPSLEYTIIERLANTTAGVLLLTATPEQLGKESHFARLRLLDPDRFSSFADFSAEEQSYEPIADAIELLFNENADASELNSAITPLLDADEDARLLEGLHNSGDSEQEEARTDLIDHLLDRHGTGRVLFRNTRAAISGFPGRELHAYSMAKPDAYDKSNLTPERLYRNSTPSPDWVSIDPRIAWLEQMIKDHRGQKLLLIAASSETALDLSEALRVNTGFQAAVFHEGMSIVERDRAAAFFADEDYGSQLLICSEIGSEGRNFQFAHHLLLFDLPSNPDLLEQRIGRLDRIGQTETIKIHVPYFENSAQEVLFRWYHEGMNAIEQACPAAHTVFIEMGQELRAIEQRGANDTDFIQRTRQLTEALNEQLHNGRDRLLEYNSCRTHVASTLADNALEEDSTSNLAEFMEQVFDCYGVHSEPHSERATIIRPAENMYVPFPLLLDEGMTVTFDRATALANEDWHFLTWDHGMVIGALDLILGAEKGNCGAIAVKTAGLKPGTLLLETLFVIDSPQHTSRYLPPSTIRVLVNEQGQALHHAVSFELLSSAAQVLDRKTSVKVVKARNTVLEGLIKRTRSLAEEQSQAMLEQAHQAAEHALNDEISRLETLQRINPNVRDVEIQALNQELANVNSVIDAMVLRLDALRVVVAV
ncbi:MAG: RNA polymerase-associated protein RapA [Pseudomonadales bacterium]